MTGTKPECYAAEIEDRWSEDLSKLGLPFTDFFQAQDLRPLHRRNKHASAQGQRRSSRLIFKLGKKYGKSETACTEPVVSIYLSEVEFNTMAALPGTNATKLRYAVADGSLDMYQNPNAGLAIFEIEFASEAAATGYAPPGFVTQEVTHNPRYSGFALSQVFE